MALLTDHAFILILVTAAASLALWILLRYAQFGPRSFVWAAVHAVVACALLRFVPIFLHALSASGIPYTQYFAVFGVALPLFVYSFLSGGWVTRIALGLLRP